MLPVLFSLAGPELSTRERDFFRAAQPAGFILFNRNVTGRAQLRRLTSELREILGRDRPPILIDQEGGRVQMLARPPEGLPDAFLDLIGRNVNSEFPLFPAPSALGALFARDERAGVRAAHLNARLLAAELADCGITVNCAPSLDIPAEGAHAVIGDRAFGGDARAVVALGRATLHGYRLEGVSPCLKHIPGHGRAPADSHVTAPRIDAPLELLRETDFAPFKELADAPFAMTAHVIYAAFDGERPATVSPETIRKAIRGHCGFHGALISDAIEMGALSGALPERALTLVKAGCDAALYCSGKLEEMEAIASALPGMSLDSAARFQAAEIWGAMTPMSGDRKAFRAERDRLLALNS
jgi:beta-N-acetylhexosaminidase